MGEKSIYKRHKREKGERKKDNRKCDKKSPKDRVKQAAKHRTQTSSREVSLKGKAQYG